MRLGEVGEFNFIDSIARLAGCPAAPVLVGIGDDAAVLDVGSAQKLVVTTDAMVQGVHFRRDWLAPHQIGWRAMAACLSDIAAMGAQPAAVFASVALPADLDPQGPRRTVVHLCRIVRTQQVGKLIGMGLEFLEKVV